MKDWETTHSRKTLSNPKIDLQITMHVIRLRAMGKYGWRLDKTWMHTGRGVLRIAFGYSETLEGAQEAAEKKTRFILFEED